MHAGPLPRRAPAPGLGAANFIDEEPPERVNPVASVERSEAAQAKAGCRHNETGMLYRRCTDFFHHLVNLNRN